MEVSPEQVLAIIGAMASVIVTLAGGIVVLWKQCTAAEREWRSEVIKLLNQLLVIAKPPRDEDK